MTLLAASKTPVGKSFIKGASNKFLKSGLGREALKYTTEKVVKNTGKEIAQKATKETIKEVGNEVAKVGLNIGKGVAKSPHIRVAHTRRLANGLVIQVKEAAIHKAIM